jgi:hypothetical protein
MKWFPQMEPYFIKVYLKGFGLQWSASSFLGSVSGSRSGETLYIETGLEGHTAKFQAVQCEILSLHVKFQVI